MWDLSQGQNIRGKAIFITDTVNPQADIQPTWKCEVWVRDVDLLKPGCNKNSELNPFLNTKPVKQPVRMTYVHRYAIPRTSQHLATCLQPI